MQKNYPLLFSIDHSFAEQLQTTLYSIFMNSSQSFDIYILHTDLSEEIQRFLESFCGRYGSDISFISIPESYFSDAPSSSRYPKAIYYRLLAHEFLPKDLTKILYLDADILCINDLTSIFNYDLGSYLYAGCSHPSMTGMSRAMNKLRLKTYGNDGYFNSGVLLINLDQVRKIVDKQAIYTFIKDNEKQLVLPDQDILNGLYGHLIYALDDQIWNYDVRYTHTYYLMSNKQTTLDWMMQHTVFLHFCGKEKPWDHHYEEKFAALYKHYQVKSKELRKL